MSDGNIDAKSPRVDESVVSGKGHRRELAPLLIMVHSMDVDTTFSTSFNFVYVEGCETILRMFPLFLSTLKKGKQSLIERKTEWRIARTDTLTRPAELIEERVTRLPPSFEKSKFRRHFPCAYSSGDRSLRHMYSSVSHDDAFISRIFVEVHTQCAQRRAFEHSSIIFHVSEQS